MNGAAYKAFSPNAERRGLPIVKIAELKAGVTEQTAFSDVSMPIKYRIDTGDLLFSWSGNPDTSIDTFIWTVPELAVFDSEFVEENVYSGFEVRSEQRQSLLDFALGDQAVALKKKVDGLTRELDAASRARADIVGKLNRPPRHESSDRRFSSGR